MILPDIQDIHIIIEEMDGRIEKKGRRCDSVSGRG